MEVRDLSGQLEARLGPLGALQRLDESGDVVRGDDQAADFAVVITPLSHLDPHPGGRSVWPGDGVIYSQRVSAQRTRSRLGKIVGTPAYKSMTIRSWATTMALLERMEAPEA